MFTFSRFVIAFLALTGAAVIATGLLGVEFGNSNFWDHHGLMFLFFITAVPRLTLLLSSVATGGVLWWIGFIFAPRILVAILATFAYWNKNPILVVISWLIAVGGESSEKYITVKRSSFRTRKGYDDAKWVDSSVK